MRPSCIYCASKHVAQATILMLEAYQGYPLHRWLAVGHLGEAGDETIADFPQLCQEIRAVRLQLMDQEPGFDQNTMLKLLEHVREAAVKDGSRSDKSFLEGVLHG